MPSAASFTTPCNYKLPILQLHPKLYEHNPNYPDAIPNHLVESCTTCAVWWVFMSAARYCWDHSLPNRWGGIIAGRKHRWTQGTFKGIFRGYGGNHCPTFIQTADMATCRPCTLGPSLNSICHNLPATSPFLCRFSWLHICQTQSHSPFSFAGNLAPVTVLIVQIQCTNGQTLTQMTFGSNRFWGIFPPWTREAWTLKWRLPQGVLNHQQWYWPQIADTHNITQQTWNSKLEQKVSGQSARNSKVFQQ